MRRSSYFLGFGLHRIGSADSFSRCQGGSAAGYERLINKGSSRSSSLLFLLELKNEDRLAWRGEGSAVPLASLSVYKAQTV